MAINMQDPKILSAIEKAVNKAVKIERARVVAIVKTASTANSAYHLPTEKRRVTSLLRDIIVEIKAG